MITLMRLVAKALAFVFLLPMIHGIAIHGGFLAALLMAIFFSVMLWGVEVLALALSTYLAVTTFGLALLVLVPAWLVGFWLLPAMALKLVADFFPTYLSVGGWTPAVLGGLLLMVVSMITGSMTTPSRESV